MNSTDNPKPFIEHLEDLRSTLLKMGGVLILSMVLCFVFVKKILSILYMPLKWAGLDPSLFLKVLGVADPFTLTLEVAFFAGLIFALPFILYFLADFVLPALTPDERKMLAPVFAAGTGLFAGGVAFCFFIILPQALLFFFDFSKDLGFSPEWTIQSYISFTVQMLLAFGVAFELPLVILALAKLGLVDAPFLRAYRRHAVVLIVVAAAIITPTSDLFTLLLMATPMWVLYEICIFLCRWIKKRDDIYSV